MSDSRVEQYLALVTQTMSQVNRYMVMTPDGRPYLERFDLRKDATGAGSYIHFLWASDEDRDPHCHPFDFESTILHGGYRQIRYDAQLRVIDDNFFREGRINRLRAADLHRLELLAVPTVTLIHRGPKVREWGFQTPQGWVSHRDYAKAQQRSTEL